MNNLQGRFNENWRDLFPHITPASSHLLVAISGGVDSIVLADIIFNAGFHFTIVHCNFQLRGAESDRDEEYVRNLGEKYGVEVLVKKFDTLLYAGQKKLGIQEAARELRYQWFNELLHGQRPTANCPLPPAHCLLVTAHHADDNVETVLFNIFRGTGINGLHGILPSQGKIIRPFLFAMREDILSYAKEKNLQWVEDSSNESTKYTRNYIRHEVLPLLKQAFPGVTSNINNSIQRWKEGEVLYDQAIAMHKKKLCFINGTEVHLPVLKLLRSSPLKTIVFEIIKDFGFTPAQTDEVIGLLESESGKYVASATHRIIRNRKWLLITPKQTEIASAIVIEEGEKLVTFSQGRLSIELTGRCAPSTVDNVATLDAAGIMFPLILRRWKQGDYFYPLGMQKKKKISRFLVDQKVSLSAKENVWVIECNKKILWIIDHRIDDRFKITSSTKQVLRISFQKN